MGVGEGDGAGQQARFANPFQPRGIAIAVEYMHAGKAGLLTGGAGAWFDDGDTREDVAAVGCASSYITVADSHAGDVGDGIERTGLQLSELDVQVAGAWFHGFSHLRFVAEKRGISGTVDPLWERRCGDPTCSRRRSVSRYQRWLTQRLREQARSHKGMRWVIGRF
ncbi:hypothetical protein D3C78_1379190 [compost metagenome]